MQPLDRNLRRQLEATVKDARDIAETAAKAALDQLGVGDAKVPAYLSPDQRDLRLRLRAHGRQLGDTRNAATGTQKLDRLVEEVAYEHWHRMLFARFLAENNLLMYPDPVAPVPVSLDDCAELAPDEGAANAWELASRYAARMLPQIFRPTSPVFALTLPPEHQHALERLLEGLAPAVFTASDGLGWVYQFWQAKRKDEVNASEVKIGARELPAVTQLFTEPYMVSFLIDNALGAWWVGKVSGQGGGPELRPGAKRVLETAATEDELRAFFALPGVPLEYLRFVRDEDGPWRPAAGWFEGWPDNLAELTMLDPCCGSGHFLVAVLIMLAPMRMELEGLTAHEAVDAALAQNIHGLEIDQRCVEIAAFALALTAWTYHDAGGYRALPELNLACSGLSVSVGKEQWRELGLGKRNLALALEWMHDTFQDAPVLGSLLNPAQTDAARLVPWAELSSALTQALQQEQAEEQREVAVVAQGLAKAATLLGSQYTWIVTNVPYLTRGKQDDILRDFCEVHYPEAKNDLATVFLDRSLDFCVEGGTSSIVLPQNWLFLTSYKKFREKLLRNDTWHLIARLGPQAFQTPMWDFNVQLLTLSRGNAAHELGGLFGESADGNLIRGLDVSEPRTADEKAVQLTAVNTVSVEQAQQLKNPDAIVVPQELDSGSRLSDIAQSVEGLSTGDKDRFLFSFWELEGFFDGWEKFQSSPQGTHVFDGLQLSLRWENGAGALAESKAARIQGNLAWGQQSVILGRIKNDTPTFGIGMKHDKMTASIVPHADGTLRAIWCFLVSPNYKTELQKITQRLDAATATLVKVPFDLDHWTRVAAEQYPHGLPEPYTDDPTQWIFHGHPCGSVIWDEDSKWTAHGPLRTDATVLQVAVARLLGYRWPAELDQNMDLAAEQRTWVQRSATLLPLADKDGIVCIPPVRGELSAAERLTNLLAAAFGEAWGTHVMDQLLAAVGWQGKPLDVWLRDKFFGEHCKLFGHRPFIWHIWDGQNDGFAALVNYHKLDHKLLETLIYTYLGDWIRRQQQDVDADVDGAQGRLAAARTLRQRLELILEGEDPYDIFVRWKPLEEQPIGWDPDLNDGVRLNIRPFMSVPDVGRKGAGVLRDKPNIKWTKDRGKDVESAPWYHLGPFVGGNEGDRINDYHLSLAEKRQARAAQ